MKTCARLLLALSALLQPFEAAAGPEGCQYLEIARAPIRYTGLHLSPSIQASINDKPATMLVDTGAFSSFLTMEGARRHGLRMEPSFGEVEGISGTSGLFIARVERLSFGPGTTVRASMPVLADMAHSPSWDGLVGAYFLFQADLELHFGAREIKFFRPEQCDSAFLGYWDARAVVVPMGFWSGKRKTPYFTIRVNGRELKAVIDSGASASSMTLRAARSIGVRMKGAGAREAGYASGIGREQARQWVVRFDSVQIGNESILDTDLTVIEAQGAIDADVLLGEDFLRSHRVLFAMSQKKIYLSYTGGDVFRRHDTLEPWLLREAEEGNADAQYNLALRHFAGVGGAPKSEETALSWLTRAAALGHAQANLDLGYDLLRKGRYADSAVRLRGALDTWSDDTEIALALHLARLGSNAPELAREELAPFAGARGGWLAPVVDHYLGKIGLPELLARAAADKENAARLACQARYYASQRLDALKDAAGAAALAVPSCRDGEPVSASQP